MRSLAILTTVALLALVSCGKPEPVADQTENIAEPITALEGDPSNDQSGASNQVAGAFSEEDILKIRNYGTCASIMRLTASLMNKNGVTDFIDIYSHRGAIYSILTLEVISKYPKELNQDGFEIANEFLNEKIAGNTITGEILTNYKNEYCDINDIDNDDIHRIMEEKKDFYEELKNQFKSAVDP